MPIQPYLRSYTDCDITAEPFVIDTEIFEFFSKIIRTCYMDRSHFSYDERKANVSIIFVS